MSSTFVSGDLQFVTAEFDPKTSSRLEMVNKTNSIQHALQARIKDPLWMLGKQFQLGEFRAQHGGHPVRVELEVQERQLDTLVWEENGNTVSETVEPEVPLEMKVEEEKQVQPSKFKAKGWNPKRFEYSFGLKRDDTELLAEEYYGSDLDWFHFDLTKVGQLNEAATSIAVKPVPATFKGMPLPRWWSLEDGQVDLGQIKRPHLNFLTELLIEFAFIYSNDWYVIPLAQKVGNIRRVDKLVIIDSFGVSSEATPVIDKTPFKQGWEVFTLTPRSGQFADGSVFYLPNRLYQALESEPVERVRLLRDEMANLVWAVEQLYQNADGEVVNRNDEELAQIPEQPKPSLYWDTEKSVLVELAQIEDDQEPGNRYVGPVALYQTKTHIPINWIPYMPKRLDTEGNYVLRRARTIEDTSKGPQYRGVFLAESKHVFEEEVPRSGIMLTRVFQMARDSDGKRYCWRSRKKRPDVLPTSSGLQFDHLIENS